jgi:hypothetical protein
MIERDPEIRVHAANHVIHGRHPGPFSGLWILPREILVYELGDRFGDDLGFAFQFNVHLYLFRHFDRVDFSRSLV